AWKFHSSARVRPVALPAMERHPLSPDTHQSGSAGGSVRPSASSFLCHSIPDERRLPTLRRFLRPGFQLALHPGAKSLTAGRVRRLDVSPARRRDRDPSSVPSTAGSWPPTAASPVATFLVR